MLVTEQRECILVVFFLEELCGLLDFIYAREEYQHLSFLDEVPREFVDLIQYRLALVDGVFRYWVTVDSDFKYSSWNATVEHT